MSKRNEGNPEPENENQNQNEVGRLLDASEVARIVGIHKDEVYRMAKAGEIPSIAIGSRRRFPANWLRDYLREQARRQGVDTSHYGDAI
jgi:excisionase family DNA binding protein